VLTSFEDAWENCLYYKIKGCIKSRGQKSFGRWRKTMHFKERLVWPELLLIPLLDSPG
jgi:hypothetical protein